MKTANPINTTNAMGKKRKRPKNAHKAKKDEENILSKDLDDDNIRYMMDTKKNLKPREDLKSSFTLKNLRFKPQKYKGSFLPYHLRWIFNNNVKTNEIVLLQEIEGLENEINRLKCLKLINRECRKIAGLPFGITTNFCQCCHLFEKKKHDCSHKYCNNNCPRKKAEELMQNLLKNNNKLKQNNPIDNNTNNNENNKSEIKDKNNTNKISLNPNEKNNVNNNEENIETPKTYIINLSKNQPNKNNVKEENINPEPIISLGKKNNNINRNDNSNQKEILRVNTIPINRQLIFEVVRPRSRERTSIFKIQSDNNMGSCNTIYDFGDDDSSSESNQIEINSESGERENEINKQNNNLNNINSNNIKDKKKDFEITNYIVESDENDDDLEEVIDINNDNEEDKAEKIVEIKNEENKENKENQENKEENKEIKEIKENVEIKENIEIKEKEEIQEKNEKKENKEDKRNGENNENKDKDDEDDIIIINQTSPHNSDIEI